MKGIPVAIVQASSSPAPSGSMVVHVRAAAPGRQWRVLRPRARARVAVEDEEGGHRCIRCRRWFPRAQGLKRHLGRWRYAKYCNGSLTVRDCIHNGRCDHVLKFGVLRRGSSGRLQKVVLSRGDAIFVARPPRASRNLPECIAEVPRHEAEGIDLSDVTAVVECPAVAAYLAGQRARVRPVASRFFLFVLYSLHAAYTFQHRGLRLSEHTLCVGIGDRGLQQVDDVGCFRDLYESLCGVFVEATDVVLWMLVCHMLVRPHLIENVRLIACSRGITPTRAGIVEVMNYLSRRWGHVPSRMPAGQRTWRQVDVFGLASTQTLAAVYAGSHRLWQQLLQYDQLRALAAALGAMQGQVKYFHEVSDEIGRARLVCYSVGGYWTVHLARVFVPDFCGVQLLGGIRYGGRCAKVLNDMGRGSRAASELGIPSAAPMQRMIELCQTIEALGRRYGYVFKMKLSHLVCAICEAHRRDAFTVYAQRRAGL